MTSAGIGAEKVDWVVSLHGKSGGFVSALKSRNWPPEGGRYAWLELTGIAG
jgi:hypothetical protein